MKAPVAKSTSKTGPHRWRKGESGNPAGRRKGSPNKATVEVKALASEHGPAAIAELARIMTSSDSDAARVAAARELLDRAYGKPTQPMTGDFSATVNAEVVAIREGLSKLPKQTRERIRAALSGGGDHGE